MSEEIPDHQEMVKSIDALLKTADMMQAALLRESEMSRPLPRYLYHATTGGNFAQITQDGEGIKPSRLEFEDTEVVGLSDDPQFALKVASLTQRTPLERLKLIRVDVPFLAKDLIDNYLRKPDPKNPKPALRNGIHEVHYRDVIPPEAFELQPFHIDKETKEVVLDDPKPHPKRK
jgi:hypothetical protein